MSRTLPLVAIGILKPFIAALEQSGIDPDPVLQNADISPSDVLEDDFLVLLRQVTQFLNGCADVTGNHRFCSDLGAELRPAGWPMIQYALDNARSLSEFICLYIVGANGISSSINAYFETRGQYSVFGQKRFAKPEIKPNQNDAFMAGLFLSIIERQAGYWFRVEETAVAVCDPSAVTKKYEGCQIIHGNDTNHYVQFPTEWLAYSIAGNTLPAPRVVPASKDFLAMLRAKLRQEIRKGPLRAGDVADLFRLSPSALKRQLAKMGTDISQELRDARLGFAEQQLRQSDGSISTISETLGYANAANFARSFRKQTGMSPREYRRSQLSSPSNKFSSPPTTAK